MAEINLPEKNSKRKSKMPRVDLTPMVDLGFILITFFMYTTTLLEARQMKLDIPVPAPPDSRNEIPLESTLSFFLVNEHKLVYYEGVAKDESDYKTIPMSELRAVIRDKQSSIRKLPSTYSKQAHQLHVLIKPHESSKYEDLITVLDEMLINDVPFYTIMDITEEEEVQLKDKL